MPQWSVNVSVGRRSAAHGCATAHPTGGYPGLRAPTIQGLTEEYRADIGGDKYLILYVKGVCSGGLLWSATSKLRLLCLPGGAPQKSYQASSPEVNVGAQGGQSDQLSHAC